MKFTRYASNNMNNNKFLKNMDKYINIISSVNRGELCYFMFEEDFIEIF